MTDPRPAWACQCDNGWLPIPDEPEFDVDNECEVAHPFSKVVDGTTYWADPDKVLWMCDMHGELEPAGMVTKVEDCTERCGWYLLGERINVETERTT